MAMALSPLAMVIGAVTIENPSVVVKSYPHFFKELNHTQAVTLIEPL
jgi:5-enolpyruvylshikimate-3-phosphate synthase